MKKHHLALAAAFLLGTAGFVSCDKNNPLSPNKDNPVEMGLKAAAFDITLLDHEKGYEKDSLYCFEGIWKEDAFYFGYWKLDPMTPNILPDGQNELEFVISSDAAGFEGVNAASSSRCINIVQDGTDHTRYHLEWVAEGESTITFWNGEGAARKEISFKATSRKVIPIKGVLARIDGKEYKFQDASSPGSGGYQKVLKTFNSRDDFPGWDKIQILEIVGPIPLNATVEEKEKRFFMLCDICLAYIDENGNGCDWDLYDDEDEIRSLRYNDPDIEIARFPDYNWFDKEHMVKDARIANPFRFVPADFRERRIMLWSIKTRAKTYGRFSLEIGWNKNNVEAKSFRLALR